MKVFAIITVARQVDGDYVFVKPEKAFKDSKSAEAFVKTIAAQRAETISGVECLCERGVFEIEVEE
jgi:hypothetical protein